MENNKWRIEVQGCGQIADTGDYSDPYYVLTNGTIELVTKDEINIERVCEVPNMLDVVEILNETGAKWENWKLADKEYELTLKQQEVDKWKEVAKKLYISLEIATEHDGGYNIQCLSSKRMYNETINNLP